MPQDKREHHGGGRRVQQVLARFGRELECDGDGRERRPAHFQGRQGPRRRDQHQRQVRTVRGHNVPVRSSRNRSEMFVRKIGFG